MSTAVYNQNYKRSVNKAAIPTCNIMGVDIAAVDAVVGGVPAKIIRYRNGGASTEK